MSYSFSKHLLLRAPVKGPGDYTADRQLFLDDPFFRAALYLASPSYYASLERQGFLLSTLQPRALHTLEKYINRYCYRPTPFGLFSSVSLVEWTSTTGHEKSDQRYIPNIQVDMAHQALFGEQIIQENLLATDLYESNPSIYRVLNEFRFFRTGLDEKGKHRDYQLQSIAFSKLLKDLTLFCLVQRTREEIRSHIMMDANCTQEEAAEYTSFLIDAQLLVGSFRINITGKDYLTRLTEIMKTGPEKKELIHQLLQLKSITSGNLVPERFFDFTAGLATIHRSETPDQRRTDGLLNVILQESRPSLILEPIYQQQLLAGLDALKLLTQANELTNMAQFVDAFQQHFEGQRLPLLLALDPEAGIGYQQPMPDKANSLLETLNVPYKSQPKQGGNWTQIHSFLMAAWLKSETGGGIIKLKEEDLKQLQKNHSERQILGISMLFRVIEDKVFIENAGGVNAPGLMGRFTVVDEAIKEAAKEMARQLEQQNPDLLFAELLHLADPHTDNVNRRESVYHYELPITAASSLPAEQQIPLSDLSIAIVDQMVILFSEKHQKIVIPRLTSAYNHSLNSLPLFRFLADISYQYCRYNFSFELRHLFPDLSFYPRVEYYQTILSLASWVIDADELQVLQGDDPLKSTAAFRQLSKRLSLPQLFTLAEGDQELVFNQAREEDIAFFCATIRQKKDAVLKEFPAQKTIHQYNAYLLPAKPLVIPRPPKIISKATSVPRKYIPGSEWLYLKIYSPKIGTNRLLLRLAPLLHKRYTNGKISQWFFVRYDDHAPHIRLRLKVAPADISEILIAFKTKLEDRVQQHVIREYQIDVYKRELERYAAAGIMVTEYFFWASSELVLAYLKLNQQVAAPIFALHTVNTIISAFIENPEHQIIFTQASFQQFLPEFTDRPFKVDLDKKYRELSPAINTYLKEQDTALLSGSMKAGAHFKKSIKAVVANLTTDESQLQSYLRSIIHMHFNRIFTDGSRKQEMICYYFLHKYLVSVQGRSKKNPLSGRF